MDSLPTVLLKPGEADRSVQAYNFRLCLTNVPANTRPFPKPAGYDPARFVLLDRYIEAGIWDALHSNIPMPNGKTDLNNNETNDLALAELKGLNLLSMCSWNNTEVKDLLQVFDVNGDATGIKLDFIDHTSKALAQVDLGL
jgi:hypothetical protein